MVKPKAKDIKKKVKEQDEEVYGDTSISGSMPDPASDDDIDEALEQTLGKDSAEEAGEHKTHTLAEEVEDDEISRRTKPEIDVDED